MSQFTQLVLIPEVTSPQKPIPPQHQIPVILAKYHQKTCGFKCGLPIRIGEPIYRMNCGKWAHTHDVNDNDIFERGAKLLSEAIRKEQGSRLIQDGAFVGCKCLYCSNGQPETCVGE